MTNDSTNVLLTVTSTTSGGIQLNCGTNQDFTTVTKDVSTASLPLTVGFHVDNQTSLPVRYTVSHSSSAGNSFQFGIYSSGWSVTLGGSVAQPLKYDSSAGLQELVGAAGGGWQWNGQTLPLANGAKISAGSVKVGNASADFSVTLGVSIDKGTKAKFGVYVPQDTSVKTLTMNVAEKNGLSEDPTFVIRPVKTDL